MGFLHEGHMSLIREARKNNDIVVVSIFVNPTQFGVNEDLSAYPRNIERDIDLLTNLDVDYVFFPTDEQMYPENYKTWVNVDKITQVLCGRSRPTHFRGVTTIVAKLLNIIDPDLMFMGEKDFQQLVIVRRLVEILELDISIVACPIIREVDGLAMSSRNGYLTEEQRGRATVLHAVLQETAAQLRKGITQYQQLEKQARDKIERAGLKVDYFSIVDANDLVFCIKGEICHDITRSS